MGSEIYNREGGKQMTHTFLLEVGLEDMPDNAIQSVEKQLVEKTKKFLDDHHLNYGEVFGYSTPRRFAVKVHDLENKQPDENQVVRGPAQRIAQDEDGNWTKAAIGFSKGQGGSVEDLIIKEDKGEPYVFIEKFIPGKESFELLTGMDEVVKKIEFPKQMKWGNTSYQYGRPIHSIVALLDDTVIPFEVFDIQTGNKTAGHRFLGEEVELHDANEYEEKLKAQFVIADRAKRKALIVDQITELCEANNWANPHSYADLLDEVTDLVEYPTAFYGSFDESYLELPTVVLETSMIDHQRYFPVWSADESHLLPYFISVRNGNEEYIENVAKGNEKVISARLADAKFFYDEDQKESIADFVEKLKILDYHEKIGTIYEKQVRVNNIAQVLADKFDLNADEKADLDRASSIYKFDLVTQMVGEFTSLQGIIGKQYAEERGEAAGVAIAIEEHYLPLSAKGDLPATKVGKLLALIDKFDSLIQFFSANLIPTGSNDPYALRRQAIGVVRLMIALEVTALDLAELMGKVIVASHLPADRLEQLNANKKALLHFILDRLEQIMQGEFGISHDIRQAALRMPKQNLIQMLENAKVLEEQKETESFKELVEAITRVFNLTKTHGSAGEISENLLETNSEKELVVAIQKLATDFASSTDAEARYEALNKISSTINHFFEENMIMVDDSEVKENRLAILHNLANIAKKYADFSQLVI